jgi:drug/metabolite transporter (DMT)-like permease
LQWNVLLAVLLGAALHAGWNVLVKGGADRFLNTVSVVAGSAVAAGACLPFFPFPETASWPYLAASVLIHIIYFTFLSFAYRKGDLSLVYPLMRGLPPMFTALAAAFLLSEWPSPSGWLGVVLVSGGVLFLSADSRLSAGTRIEPLVFTLLNAGVIVTYTLVDGIGVRLSGHAFSYTGWMILLTAGMSFLALRIYRGREVTSHVARQWRRGLIGGAFTFGSYALALWAMTQAPIALVAALRETSILFGTMMAVFALKERVSRLRCLSIALIVVGLIAIKMA